MTIGAFLGLLGAWVAAITSPGPDTVQLLRLGSRSRRSAVLAALGISTGNFLWPLVTMAGLAALIAAFPWILAILYIGGGLFLLRMGIGSFRGGLADYRVLAVIPAGQQSKTTTHPDHPAGTDGTEGAEIGASGTDPGSHHAVNRANSQESWPNSAESANAGRENNHVEALSPAPRNLTDFQAPRNLTDFQASRNLTDFQSWKLGLATNLSNPKALLFFGAVFAQFLPVGITLPERIAVLLMMTVVNLIWFCGFAWAVSLPIWAEKLQRANPVIEMVAGVIFALLAMFLLYEGAITVAEYLR